MKAARHHVESLDAFRGATVAAMILVNNPGDWSAVYPQLMHASWNGCTLADLVFPSFIFIMGLAMPFAFARRRERGDSLSRLYGRIALRGAALVALGLILNLAAAWHAPLSLRVPGVLQRIGVVYFLASLIVLRAKTPVWIATSIVLLLAHWALLAVVPFDSYPAGTLTPEHNLPGYVDRLVFGRHMLTPFGDPEGVVGTMTAVATALIGCIAGEFIRTTPGDRPKVLGLAAGGVALVLGGVVWSQALPLNKPLWTGSYTLAASGVAMVAFAAFYFVVDASQIRWPFRAFVWLGVNPLAIYFLSELVGHAIEQGLVAQGTQVTTPKAWLFWRMFVPFAGDVTPAASLAFAAAYAATCLAVARALYRRGLRIHV